MTAVGAANVPVELPLRSARCAANPPLGLAVDAVFTAPDGTERRIPAFWAGDDRWAVRYASPLPGRHRFRTVCSDETDGGLHGVEGAVEIHPYTGDNLLFRHGPLRVAPSGRHLEHHDGTPFFWLGDTWWMGLCRRLAWPTEFRQLALDRVAKGFSVVQIVAGLYPDMPAYDPRGANEAGYPWSPDWGALRPAYFDHADLRIAELVHRGLVPCIVGCWAYYLPWLGLEKMRLHWRNLVARWGAWPVVWCLAGEGAMPYYLSDDKDRDRELQRQGWTELGRYVQEIDGFDRPVTIHPTDSGRDQVTDDGVLDFDMLQTGHGDRNSLPNTVRLVRGSYQREPVKPVVNGEVCYEGIGECCRQEVQRLMFYASLLSGACGYTYGANGIWQVNRRGQPFGPSPHGLSWGDTPWDDAMRLPGSQQLGLGRSILERFDWWRFEPHPDWARPHADANQPFAAYAAGISGRVRVLYLPNHLAWGPPTVTALEPGCRYQASLISPVDGHEVSLGEAMGDGNGEWRPAVDRLPIYQDWLMVLQR